MRTIVWLALFGLAAAAFAAPVSELEAKVAAEPGNLKARLLLGKAYAQQGETQKSIDAFNQILAKRRVPSVMYLLGLQYAQAGETEKAILLWLEIVTSDNPRGISNPLSTLTMEHLAGALHKQGNFEQALTWWRRTLEVDPTNEKGRRMAGVALYKLGRYREAAREWLLLLKARPPQPVVKKTLYYVALAFAKLDQQPRALKVLDKLLALDPGNAAALKLQAKLKVNEADAVPPVAEVTRADDEANKSAHQTEQTTHPGDQLPPKPDLPIPPPPATRTPPGGITSLQAEELFLDGLDNKEKGNHEKALFQFLQALDVDPKFTQVYLQVGEVYLTLARLAPTQSQFAERINLALQSLEKVGVLAPNTLLAHSAQGKIVQARKLDKEGFARFHLQSADQALKEGRHQDAFDQCILLLSNKVFQDAIFLNLVKLLSNLNRGNKQDLQFFMEDLAGKNVENVFVPYVLGMTYLSVGKVAEAKISLGGFIDRIGKLDIKDPAVDAFRAHASASKGDPTDKYLLGTLLFIRRLGVPARTALKEYIDRSKSDAPFHADAVRKIGQIDIAPAANAFEQERKELVAAVPRADVMFGPDMERSHADEKLLEDLRSFVQGRPDNGLARFMMAYVLTVRADRAPPQVSTQYLRQAEDLFLSLWKEKWPDPDWHFKVSVLALWWKAEDKARVHLKVSGDILLRNGKPASAKHAQQALDEARKLIDRGRVSAANLLLRQAQVFDPECLSYYLVKYDIDVAQGKIFGGLWNLVEWAGRAISSPWHRLLVLTNLGIMAIQVVLLTLLGAAFALVLKYFEPLQHFFVEYLRRKGMVFSLPLTIVAGLLLLPTGFIVVFPLLVWALLNRAERQTYLSLILLLLVLPLFLPMSFEGNFEQIRMAEEFRAGNLEIARPFFERVLKQNEYDYVARYILGQINLRVGQLDPADRHFSKLFDQNPLDVGVLVNLGAVKARKGDYKKALALLSQAIGRQAANLPALFDMMSISAFLGQHDKAQQYLKWAAAAARETDQLPRYQAFSSDIPQLVLMDCPLESSRIAGLFSFFSTSNFFGFNAAVFKVLGWLLIGGGLLAWLILTWQRMDFSTSKCSVCLRVTCDQCQHVVASRPLCPECVSLPQMDRERHKTLMVVAAEKQRRNTVIKGWVANLILPGSGLYLAGWTPVGAFLQAVFLALFLVWWQNGGVLLSTVHQMPDLPIIKLLLWFSLVVAMGIYGLAQLAYKQLEEEVRPV